MRKSVFEEAPVRKGFEVQGPALLKEVVPLGLTLVLEPPICSFVLGVVLPHVDLHGHLADNHSSPASSQPARSKAGAGRLKG